MKFLPRILREKLRPLKKLMFPSFQFIAMDITSNCNLRCPFCINDFSKIDKNVLMKESTFDKVVTLLPLLTGNNFFFSCLFEPSIHPDFVDYLEKIPIDHGKKIFFTTNLARRIKDIDIERLSRLQIGNINISVDSFTPSVFESLRKGAKYEIFADNLDRLTMALRKRASAPDIRFITVVLQKNLKEIPEIIETSTRNYSPASHEFRSVYQVAHLSREWRLENLISNDDWAEIQDYVDREPGSCSVAQPPPNYYPDDNAPYSRKLENGQQGRPPLALEITSTGTVTLVGRQDIRFNIDEIDDPFAYFNSRKRELSRVIQIEPSCQ